jgi:hypothetical protein
MVDPQQKRVFERCLEMRGLLCAIVFLAATSPASGAQQVDDDGSYSVLLSAGVGRFSGDYGEAEETTLDVLSLSARWYLDRGEIQISLP